MTNLTIAIDGPASSGKSTIAKEIARQLGITYIDTGAMYRAITLGLLQNNVDFKNHEAVQAQLQQLHLAFKQVANQQHIFLNGADVSEEIRSVIVTENVSAVSAIAIVRAKLVEMQQKMAQQTSVVMDGRDIGTVVLPDAPYKFFFTASAKVRAKRRYQENMAKGLTTQSLEEIEAAIIARDHYDSTREHSPLKQAADAQLIDTSALTIAEVAKMVIEQIKSA